MSVIAQRGSSVHRICQQAKLPENLAKLVSSTVQGIVESGSVMLSDIVRTQVKADETEEARRELHAREQALSCTLAKAKGLDVLSDAYLASIATDIDKLPFYSFDTSDISKPHGRHFESLDVVRDASAKQRTHFSTGSGKWSACKERRGLSRTRGYVRVRPGVSLHRCHATTPSFPVFCSLSRGTVIVAATPLEKRALFACTSSGHPCVHCARKHVGYPALKQPGYWISSIEAGDEKGTHIPLDYHLFSTQEESYQALGPHAWRLTLQSRLNRMLAYGGRNAIWTLDRGFDDVGWYNELHDKVHQSIIRAKGNRMVHPGTKEQPAQRLAKLARGLALPHSTRIPYVDKSTHERHDYGVKFTFIPVCIEGIEHKLWLLVVDCNRRNPWYLITDRAPKSIEQAAEWIHAYTLRWKNEECTRVLKGVVGLENFRVRNLCSIRRLLSMVLIAVGLVAYVALFRPRLRQAIVDRALEFIKHVQFKVYRMWRVLQRELNDKTSPPILYWRI